MSREINEMDKRCVKRHNDLAKNFNTMSQQHTRMMNNENINVAKEIFTHAYGKASSYSNLIIVAGYVGFFSFWASLKKDLPEWAILASGFCILLSLLIFIGFELYKMVSISIKMNRISTRLNKPGQQTLSEIQAIESEGALSAARIWVFTVIPTIFFGLSAGLILLFCFLSEFIKPFID